MSKFGRRLIAWILLVIVILGGLSLLINTQFVERYYLKTKKDELRYVYEEIIAAEGDTFEQLLQKYYKKESLWILPIKWSEDQDQLNERLIETLEWEGIRIKKLWLWEKDLQRLEEGLMVNQLYNQGKLGYSVLMKCFKQGNQLIVICSMVAHVTPIIEIINVFFLGVWGVTFILMAIGIMWFVRRLTKPLMEIKGVADAIAHLSFERLALQTGDELQSVAESINQMSDALKASHEQLELKNHAMKRLLSDVSHELKTPIALIKAYIAGVEDGLDDGTFLKTIGQQNDIMAYRVDQLLKLSRLENQDQPLEAVCLGEVIDLLLDEQKLLIKQQELVVTYTREGMGTVWGNEEAIKSILENLLSNSIKYTQDHRIEVVLKETREKVSLAL
ncbi:MAG: sensor histidine kinase, partial [Cellulosilyticaceae bacterium]